MIDDVTDTDGDGIPDSSDPHPNQQAQTIAWNNTASRNLSGGSFSLGASTNSGLTLTYASSNTSIATVNSSGLVTPLTGGAFTITISAPANASYFAASLTTASITVIDDSYTATKIITQSVSVDPDGSLSQGQSAGDIYVDGYKFSNLHYIYNAQLLGDDYLDQIFAFRLTAKPNQSQEFLGANNEGVYIWNPRFYNNEWWPRWSHEDEIASDGDNRCFMFYNMNNSLFDIESLIFRYNSYPNIGDGINARQSEGFKSLTSTARSPGGIENFNISDENVSLNGSSRPPVQNYGTFGSTFAQNFNVVNAITLGGDNWNSTYTAHPSRINSPSIALEVNLQYDSMNNSLPYNATNGGNSDDLPVIKNDTSLTASIITEESYDSGRPSFLVAPFGGSYTVKAKSQINDNSNVKSFDHFRITYNDLSVVATPSAPSSPEYVIDVPGTIDAETGEYTKGTYFTSQSAFDASFQNDGHYTSYFPKVPQKITAMYKDAAGNFGPGPVLKSGRHALTFGGDEDGDGVSNEDDNFPLDPNRLPDNTEIAVGDLIGVKDTLNSVQYYVNNGMPVHSVHQITSINANTKSISITPAALQGAGNNQTYYLSIDPNNQYGQVLTKLETNTTSISNGDVVYVDGAAQTVAYVTGTTVVTEDDIILDASDSRLSL